MGAPRPLWLQSADSDSRGRPGAAPRYVELHCQTNYSFLRGASHPDELVKRAAELGHTALAVTDHNSLAGAVRAHVAAKAIGLKLLVGAEITPEDALPVLLYATDRKAYGHLARLITRGRRSAEKGNCILHFRDLVQHAEGVLAVVLPHPSDGREDDWLSLALYRDVFADRCHLAAVLCKGPDDDAELDRLVKQARRARLPLVATNDVHYHDPDRRQLHEVLTAIRYGVTVAELGVRRFANAERHLKSPAEMAELFRRCPQAIANGVALAERCRFSLDELRYEYPEEICPPATTATQHLANLTWAGARERYPQGVPDKVASLIRRELALIEELRYEAYFLTVWDLVKFARERGILCQGRGSAANSAICYCLGITAVDPERTDVLFERFVSREREEAPDIDVDFEHERREEVIQYVYGKYGRDRAGLVAEVIAYRPRSAVRDVGKALGLSLDCVDRLAKVIDHYEEGDLPERVREAGLDPQAAEVSTFTRLVTELLGFPRHLSQHVGGFVITRGLLSELVPLENAAMPERTVIEWDKDDVEALGILKVDCLALGMLTAIRKTFSLLAEHHGVTVTMGTVSPEDQAVYDMICRADTVGVFQIESRAQMSMLPRLLPRCFYDLVVEVAIVRPGPIQGGMVHPYLRRRSGQEPVTYPSPAVEQVLAKTFGVPIFQEQVMRLAMVAAGFTAGEADQLRRAMGAWKRRGVMEPFREKLRDGMVARGIPVGFADRLYEQIRGFAEYGFPESHAASFALLTYISAWLKCHFPAAFAAALLNSQPMGFYAPAQLIRDAQTHGVVVLPVDVNHSEVDCTLESASAAKALRLGFRLVKGLARDLGEQIAAARSAGPFRSLWDLLRRSRVGRPALARLAAADAFGSLALTRRAALWQILSFREELPLFADIDDSDQSPPLAPMALREQITADYAATGLSLKAHPISLIRQELDQLRVSLAAALTDVPDKAKVCVAGLVLVRQSPGTAKGTVFITLEDETGTANLVIWSGVWKRYREKVRSAVALYAEGRIERAGSAINIIVGKMEDLSDMLSGIAGRSRDFR
ncbi:MAG: error-prone DNA polymerase [Planctomycetota bacterium]|nr:MAG: error-prone DNA polymerase [Planctomycetota bacterium]